MSEQPGKGAAHKGHSVLRRQISMRNQHPLDWPGENLVEGDPRRATIEEARTPVTRCARIGGDDPTMPSEEAAPSFEPVARKILDQIGEQGRVAATMKKHDLGQRKASVHHDLVDVSRPIGPSRIAKLGIEGQVFAFAPQPRRGVDASRWKRGLPFRKEQMMQCIG